MARELLTSRTIDALKPKRNAVGKPTSYEVADGGNLFLKVSEGGGKSWVFRFMLQKRRDAFGLGPYPDRTIDAARKLATEYRQLLLDGIDPRRYRDTQKAAQGVAHTVPTYAELVPVFLATRSDPRDWRSRLAAVTPSLGGIPVDRITFNYIRDALAAVGSITKREACRKRLGVMFAWAKATGYIADNPYDRDALKAARDQNDKHEVQHHAKVPWQAVGSLFARLKADQDIRSKALQFVALTASRIGEVVKGERKAGMLWSEVDGATWNQPASKTKNGKPFRLPLSSAALELLAGLKRPDIGDGLVFQTSSSAVDRYWRTRKTGATVHGLRGTFRDWFADTNQGSHELGERCLQHSVGDTTARSYLTTDELDNRRPVMQAWADHLSTAPVENVTPMPSRAA